MVLRPLDYFPVVFLFLTTSMLIHSGPEICISNAQIPFPPEWEVVIDFTGLWLMPKMLKII